MIIRECYRIFPARIKYEYSHGSTKFVIDNMRMLTQ